jgi:hypothetical protein
VRRHHDLAYHLERGAQAGTTIWHTTSNAELKDFHQREEQNLLSNRQITWKRVAKSGDASFIGVGIPMFQGEGAFTETELKATALATRGWWHHSIECTIDKLDWDYMQDHLRVYAAYLWELCTAPVLPFTYAPVAEQVVKRLKELEQTAALDLAGLLSAANQFSEAARKFDAYSSGKLDDAAAVKVNRAMKRLSRELVPLMSSAIGKYGHDPYGYTPQTTMIPALYDVAALAKLPQGEERWMLETKVVRERNRVADALAECIHVAEDALAAG